MVIGLQILSIGGLANETLNISDVDLSFCSLQSLNHPAKGLRQNCRNEQLSLCRDSLYPPPRQVATKLRSAVGIHMQHLSGASQIICSSMGARSHCFCPCHVQSTVEVLEEGCRQIRSPDRLWISDLYSVDGLKLPRLRIFFDARLHSVHKLRCGLEVS